MQKIKARLLVKNHAKKYEYQDTYTTEKMIAYWWRLFNISLFDKKLPFPKKLIIKNFKNGNLGYCQLIPNENNIILGMRRTYDDKKVFLTVLVHEMVHHYEQIQHNRMTHGETFYTFADKIKNYYGLTLSEEVVVD